MAVTRAGTPRQRITRYLASQRVYPYLLVAPAVLFLLSLFVYPLIYSLLLSLQSVRPWQLRTGGEYVGLENFLKALQDPMVLNSAVKTAVFMVSSVSLELVFGLLIALLLNTSFRGRRFVRAIALAPMMLTPVVLGINFKMMFNYLYGVFNWALNVVGLPPVLWLSDSFWAMVAVVATEVWNQTPFITLVVLAGLQSVPTDLYEAAKVDGASGWNGFWRITMPLIRPMIVVAVFWRSVATFRVFDVVYVLTSGGPVDATETLSILVNKVGFGNGQFGYAAAISYYMILTMFCLGALYHLYLRKTD